MATIILGFLGSSEIIIILLVVVLLFGGKKIPELMRGLGGGIKEFKEASKTDEERAAEKRAAEKKKELNDKE